MDGLGLHWMDLYVHVGMYLIVCYFTRCLFKVGWTLCTRFVLGLYRVVYICVHIVNFIYLIHVFRPIIYNMDTHVCMFVYFFIPSRDLEYRNILIIFLHILYTCIGLRTCTRFNYLWRLSLSCKNSVNSILVLFSPCTQVFWCLGVSYGYFYLPAYVGRYSELLTSFVVSFSVLFSGVSELLIFPLIFTLYVCRILEG